jgi:hypothetical protein
VDAMGNADTTARWDSGSPDVELESEGAEAVLYFNGPGDYIIHAYGAGGSASATIHVLRAFAYAPGATKWSVESFNGCKTRQPVRAIPAPRSTNDVFMVDECPRGTVVRALTSEGLENWRTWMSDKGTALDFNNLSLYEPKKLLGTSICDKVKIGMTRDDAIEIISAAQVRFPEADHSKDVWLIEEAKTDCKVTFSNAHVTRKQKIINN